MRMTRNNKLDYEKIGTWALSMIGVFIILSGIITQTEGASDDDIPSLIKLSVFLITGLMFFLFGMASLERQEMLKRSKKIEE
jgi:hypothetical protein